MKTGWSRADIRRLPPAEFQLYMTTLIRPQDE